jgi:hypothetical protein
LSNNKQIWTEGPKIAAEGCLNSPPQEVEEGARSSPYLLVIDIRQLFDAQIIEYLIITTKSLLAHRRKDRKWN